jgi:hypothetical protein
VLDLKSQERQKTLSKHQVSLQEVKMDRKIPPLNGTSVRTTNGIEQRQKQIGTLGQRRNDTRSHLCPFVAYSYIKIQGEKVLL